MSFSVDLREFNEAIDLREKRGTKTLVAITNKALLNVAYKSAQFTEVTGVAKINEDLRKPGLLAKLTAIRLRGRKVPDFAAEMERTRNIRLSSVRYLRSGFAPIVRALGGTFRGRESVKLNTGIHSTGHTGNTPQFTWIIDEPHEGKAASAEAKVFPSIQRAIDFVSRDMINHDIDAMNKALA